MTNIIEQLDSEQLKAEVPEFGPGDTVRVQVKVKEGNRERLQAFEGVVIARKNRGLNSSFTVRKMSYGEGVERVFQTHSPLVADIGSPSARRCASGETLLPARGRTGKSARIQEKISSFVSGRRHRTVAPDLTSVRLIASVSLPPDRRRTSFSCRSSRCLSRWFFALSSASKYSCAC